jgi:hypothetical protein
MHILHVVGARPNFVKAAPVMRALERWPRVRLQLRRGEMVEGNVLATGLRPAPIEYRNLPVRFEIVFFDQFEVDYRSKGLLSVLRYPPDPARQRKGGGLYEWDGKPPALSIGEETRLRYLAMVAQEKLEREQKVQR